MEIVGRKSESAEMKALLEDDTSHMLALIGRRRVGKTFLIRELYAQHIVFEMTGLKDGTLGQQLLNFTFQYNRYFPKRTPIEPPADWLAAFHLLTKRLEKSRSQKKRVLFFDELPWIAGKRSGFTEALAHWWNNWASKQQLILVLCGSAASWMIDHVVNAKGGLHNRITKLITLQPFTLAETKEYLSSKHIRMSDFQIVQLYMALGGVPHYLAQVEKSKSAAQNIQHICFDKDGLLRNEFESLYSALFDNAHNHIQVIKALASKSKGMDRQQILTLTSMEDGGWFSKLLQELEASGFITAFHPIENKKKNKLYRLTDEFSLFYLNFMEGQNNTDGNYWTSLSQTQEYKIWCGYAFENTCTKHTRQLKKALGIEGIQSTSNSFLHRKNAKYDKGFQIDLLIDRKDDVITLCEMKFHSDEFTITPEYASKLHLKREGVKALVSPKKTIEVAFVSAFGVTENEQKMDYVDHDLRINILFES